MRPRLHLRRIAAGALAVCAPLALLAVTPPAGAATAPLPLDPTWGNGGIANPFIPGSVEKVEDLAVSPDGGAVAVLESRGLAAGDFVLVKFAADGTLDPSFGDDGMLTTGISSGSDDRARAVAIQPDGRIVVAGWSRPPTGFARFAVVRYLADGRLDPSFSGDGKTTTSFGGLSAAASAVELRPDGRMLVTGTNDGALAVASYQANGVLDRTFDVDGRMTAPIGDDETGIYDTALDTDGTLLVTGYAGQTDTSWDTLVVRLRPDGALDPAFGVGGMVYDDYGFGDDVAEAIAVQPDGKIVIAGMAEQDGFHGASVARYTPEGALDPAFGSGGRVAIDIEGRPGSDTATGVAVLSDGRIALSGPSGNGGGNVDAFVAMLTADGALDPTFDAGDGQIVLDLGTPGVHDRIGAQALSAEGTIMVAGTYGPLAHRGEALSVARFETSTPYADLHVALTATPNPAPAGPIELAATVRNDGPVTATDVRVGLEGVPGIRSIRASAGRCSLPTKASPTPMCVVGDLAPGAEVLVTFGATVTGPSTATAYATSGTYDIEFGDNASTVDIAVVA